MIQCKRMCRKHMFLLTTVVQTAVSRGLHVPGGVVELGGPATSRAQLSITSSLFLLVYLSGLTYCPYRVYLVGISACKVSFQRQNYLVQSTNQ